MFEALGVRVTAPPAVVERCLAEAGIGFFFAPTFHPSMRHAGPTRRALGVRTAFNLLGPLTNPAGATRQLVGVPRPEFTELLARALLLLGSERAWVVHGADGIDEISTTGYTQDLRVPRRRGEHVLPASRATSGCRRRRAAALAGGDAQDERRASSSASSTGERGPARDVVLLNAGAALFIAGKAASVEDGMRARGAARSTAATRARTLERLVRDLGGRGVRRQEPAHDVTTVTAGGPARDDRRRDAPDRRGARRAASRSRDWRSRAERCGTPRPGVFRAALAAPDRVNVIAECKRRSPSRGVLRARLRSGGDRRAATRRPARRRFRC